MASNKEERSFRLVGMTSNEFEELLEDAYVDSLPSDNDSVVSDVIDSDGNDDDEGTAVEMLLMDSEGEFQQEDSEDDVPLSILRTTLRNQAKEKSKPPVWGKLNRPSSPPLFVAECGVPGFLKNFTNMTPYQLFQLFFTDDFIDHLVFHTNLYAEQEHLATGKSCTNTNIEEMKAFLGLNLLMGMKRLPSYKDYWSSAPDLHDPYISSIMTLKKFSWLLSHLHLNDNSMIPSRDSALYDKLYKVRPMLDHLAQKFEECLLPSKELALDESMIKFKGRSTMKQYMPKKPIKRGYKVWMLCDKSGYCLKFDIYTGKSSTGNVEKSLGSRVVKKLTEGYSGKNHQLFFDNFFNSVELMEYLKDKGICAVGTVNISRRHMPIFKPDKQLNRGEFDWYTSDSGLLAMKWKDKRSVHLLSNYHKPENRTEVDRRERSGNVVKVSCPQALVDYNSNMNGVDKFDQLLSSYKINRQSKKWWHRIFFYFLDACVVNSYCLYKLLNLPKTTSKAFRRAIVAGLTASTLASSNRVKSSSRRASSHVPQLEIKKSKPYVPQEIRLTSSMHQPERTSRRRCALCSTKAHPVRTDWKCSTCEVPLCLGKEKNCFQTYHKK